MQPRTNGITEGVIWKQILFFFFPIVFGTFFQQLYNTADAIIVGQCVSKQALAAVGCTGNMINLLIGFFVGLSGGATVVISQRYGARSPEQVSKAVHTAIVFSSTGALVLTVAGFCTARPFLRLMQTPDDVLDYATQYVQIYYIGTLGNLLYNMGAGILRAIGDSKRPLVYLIICCAANIILDLLFVALLKLEVAGAALATILSQLISACFVLRRLMKTDDMYRLEPKKLHIDKESLSAIVHIGLPAGFYSVMYSVSNIIIQTGYNTLGTDCVAANSAYGKIDGLFWMTINALGISITTFVGQNYGARKFDRVHKGVRVGALLGIIMTSIIVATMLLGGHLLIGFFTPDEAVRAFGAELIRIIVPFFFAYIPIEVCSSSLRGIGDCWPSTIITCVGVCILRVAWIAFMLPGHPSIFYVAVCYPISWVLTAVAFLVYFICFSRLGRRSGLGERI